MKSSIQVLFVGTSPADAKRRHEELQCALDKLALSGSPDSRVTLVSNVSPTLELAWDKVPTLKELDVVCVDSSAISADVLWEGRGNFVRLLGNHPSKPWISFSDEPGLYVLVLFLEGYGMHVELGEIAGAILDRWSEMNAAHSPHQIA